ncbi:MAG: C40 family peptidase [Ferruginibacter sp.]|nr:C40 family peptidase [Ferruginibacter sp.]
MKNLLSLAMCILLVTGLQLQASAQPTDHTPTQNEQVQDSDVFTPSLSKASILQKKPRTTTQTVLNKMAATVQNLPLFGFIDDWYYTRYRFGGTTKKGVDCSSFTLQLFRDVYQISLPRTARQQYEISIKVNEEEMQEGDLVFFNTRGGISHVGVYLVNGYFVHASSSRGVMVSNIREPYFSKRFLGARRIVGPMNGLL